MLDFFVPLDRALILRQAFAVLNDVGLEGLTLRRLATRLQVQAPALYWHFRSKQDLLDEMATHVLRQVMQRSASQDGIEDWREWMMARSLCLRETLLEYRDGAKMFSGTYMTDVDLFAPMEASLRRLTAVGFTLRQAVVAFSALYSLTIGFVIEEQATQLGPGRPNPQYDLAARQQRVSKELYPLAWAAGAEMFSQHDARFVEAVTLMVAGLERALPAKGICGLTD
jgi:TetR/AcrR family transcriptional regulator, tetracycline repressor protein